MKRLDVAEPAQRDLDEQIDYIARDNPAAADRFADEIGERMEWIAEVDFTGVPRDHLMPGLRACLYRGRTIYYVSTADAVTVLRVMHQARNITPEDFE